jgi:hypothetical protein
MRLLVFVLVLANLVYLGWTQWLAPDAPGAAAVVLPETSSTQPADVVRLQLFSEAMLVAPMAPRAAIPVGPSGGATPPAGSANGSAAGANGSAAGADGSAAVATDSAAAAPAAEVAGGAATPPSDAGAAAATTANARPGAAAAPDASDGAAGATASCASIGPFASADAVASAQRALQPQGVATRQRAAAGLLPDGYMVVVGRIANAAEQDRVQMRLRRGGLNDAYIIPELPDGRAVSVGQFSDRGRAERRADVVRTMGYAPSIIARQRDATVYWLDLSAPVGGPSAASLLGTLTSLASAGAADVPALQLAACPPGTSQIR